MYAMLQQNRLQVYMGRKQFFALVLAGSALIPFATHAQSYLTDNSRRTESTHGAGDIYGRSYMTVRTMSTSTNALIEVPIRNPAWYSAMTCVQGQLLAQRLRGTISSFVQDYPKAIGSLVAEDPLVPQIHLIAQTENDAAPSTITAIQKITCQGSVTSYFYGDDDKNLQALRQGLVHSQESIDRLKTLLAHMKEDSASSGKLSRQISALETRQVEIENFVKNRGSALGFFARFAGFFGTARAQD